MALTRLQLETKVLMWLDELDEDGAADNANPITRARVQEALAEANVTRATEQKWPFMVSEEEKTLTLVSGQRSYTLDATFHIPIFFWNDSTNSPLTEFREDNVSSRDYAGGVVDSFFSTSPQYGSYVIKGSTLELLWTPSSADTIRYGFYRLPEEMPEDDSYPDIPYPHSRVLIYDALLAVTAYQDDVSATKRDLWMEKQETHATALREAHGQANSVYTAPETITYIPRD